MPSKNFDVPQSGRAYVHERQVSQKEWPEISMHEFAKYAESKKANNHQEEPERGKWGKSIESLLLCISMSVGLGNVWRFPNVAYNNGGGAFLIPYLLLLFIIGRPLYYLELILGQFSSQGPIKLWRVVPAFKGIGYAQVISVAFVVIFYNYLMAISVYYIYGSMHSCLPWTSCNYPNFTENMTTAEHYFKYEVLEEDSSSPDKLTSMSWKLVVCLLITWVLVYISIIQGTNSLGKMAYFTAIFPYIVLVALLIVALQEEGSGDGIKFFFKPDLHKLLEIKVWYKACEQSFFSLAIGYGNIVMIASYNKFTNNVYKDAIIISVLDTFTNILAGCVIFAVLGSLAHQRGEPIEKVVDHEGLGLAFVIYPEALALIKIVPQLWSVLFFVMLFTLGIGSSMSQIETILTVFKDRFPHIRKKKAVLALCACGIFFSLGLSLTTNVGQHILVLLNNYGVSAAVYFYATLEVIGIMWIYGLKNFCNDVHFMLGSPPGIFWKATWAFTAPVSLIVLFIYGHIAEESQSGSLPTWATVAGWFLAFIAVVQIPIWGIYVIYRNPSRTIKGKIANCFRPSKDWGPNDPVDKAGWLAFRESSEQPSTKSNIVTLSAVYNEGFQEEPF